MKKSIIKQLSLYNYRYVASYSFYAVLLIVMLLLAITDFPRGLNTQEIASATHSATASVHSILFSDPINAPYVLLQKVFMHVFGITPIAIKLPSLILGFLTGMALVLMLRQWFSDNVAVLTSATVATGGPFLTMGRTGTALIMYAFWLSIILLSATKKLYGKEKTFRWKLLFFGAAAASLYTPMMIYPLIAIMIAGLLHPHIRYTIRQISLKNLSIVVSAALCILAPLVWSLAHNQAHITELLGFPSSVPNLEMVWHNLRIFFRVFFEFGSIQVGIYLLPLFNAATLIVVLLGILRTLADRFSARSYMLLIWTSLIFILVLFNPSAMSVIYMPIILYLAVGVETLIREWYRLFPRNPYARIAALIPLTILLVSISTANIARYFYGYAYIADPKVFHTELTNIRATLDKPVLKNKQVTLVTTKDSLAFYGLLSRDYKNLSVTDTSVVAPREIITEERYTSLNDTQRQSLPVPYRIITTGLKSQSLLLRVYISKE